MTHLYHDLEPGTAAKLTAVIEIPKGSKVKYEVDKKTGTIAVDRILSCDAGYPENYGFVPQTHFDDGDPVDVIVLSDHTLASGAIVEVRPVGVVRMKDQGEQDDKILCVLTGEPAMKSIKTLKDLSQQRIKTITNFLSTYKIKEGKNVVVEQVDDETHVPAILEKSVKMYQEKFKKK